MNRDALYTNWALELKMGSTPQEALSQVSKASGISPSRIKRILIARGVWDENLLRSVGFNHRLIVSDVIKAKLFNSWIKEVESGVSRESALKSSAKAVGITQSVAKKEIVKESLWDKWDGEHYLYVVDGYQEKLLEEDAEKPETDPSRGFWLVYVLMGLFIIPIVGYLFYAFTRPSSPAFPRGDGWYCTDQAGQNCYMDPD